MEKVDAIVLLSGGLDSALILAMLTEDKKKVMALSFDYNQRHKIELEYAKKLAEHYGTLHQIFKIDPQALSQSGLVSSGGIPKDRSLKEIEKGGYANTYVPARNTIFLSYALGQAEMREAKEIHYGPNAHDKFGFPDCSFDYTFAFQQVMNVATKQARDGQPPKLVTPLVNMTKEEIRKKATEINVPIELTLSCYDPTPEGKHCQTCDACVIRFSSSEQTSAGRS